MTTHVLDNIQFCLKGAFLLAFPIFIFKLGNCWFLLAIYSVKAVGHLKGVHVWNKYSAILNRKWQRKSNECTWTPLFFLLTSVWRKIKISTLFTFPLFFLVCVGGAMLIKCLCTFSLIYITSEKPLSNLHKGGSPNQQGH